MRKSILRSLLPILGLLLGLGAEFAVHAQDGAKQEGPFSVVLLPDTQNYSEKYPETYIAQTLWIRQQRKLDNIKFAIHLGDIVQTAAEKPEWENASLAMRLLDGVVPYSVAPGNHDMVVKARDTSLYNQYFSPARFADRKWYGGHLGKTNDNNYCFFKGGGRDFLVLNLEFAPRDEALKWAAGIARQYPTHHIIVATHSYMRPDGRDTNTPESYNVSGNSGEQMWQKLIRQQPNIFFVVSGHVLGVGLQTSVNDAGHKVLEMLTDYQGLEKGGDGWLRIITIDAAAHEIRVKTYSPTLRQTNEAPKETFSLPWMLPDLQTEKKE